MSEVLHGGAGKWINGKKTRPWPEYSVWSMMKARCLNPKNKDYSYYGGRGVKIDPTWINDFGKFIRDMGRRPAGMTLDRINSDGDYCAENCRWVSRKVQANNKRNNHVISYNGKSQTIARWSAELGIPFVRLYSRYRKGLPLEQVFSLKKFKTGPRPEGYPHAIG